MKKILVIHGPNLNLLGEREQEIYGGETLESINNQLVDLAQKHHIQLEVLQSNHEGDIVDKIGGAKRDGMSAILINPAAYTHTSVSIPDAIAAIDVPAVEVHLSNIYAREEFRHKSLIAPVASGQVSGFGVNSYLLGRQAAIQLIP